MWYFNNQVFDHVLEGFDSFVYIIERLNILEDSSSPIFYIGKKTFFYRTKYKGKRILTESDWWDYYGSSDWLSEDIEKYGKDNFKRTILHLCRTKGDSGYLEAKEQIERNVLHIDHKGYKLFYNKNILGRYRIEPEYYLIEEKLQTYFNLDTIHGNQYNKKWITNGKENRLVNKTIANDLVTSSIWTYGRVEKHIEVNDGKTNFLIAKSEFNEEKLNIGWIRKYVTNGIKDKLLPIHKIEEFIEQNPTWNIGYSKNNDDIWINDGIFDKKIKKNDLEKYKNFKLGRLFAPTKNKISIFKGEDYKWVFDYELEQFLNKGWVRKGPCGEYNLFNVTNDINQKHFRSEEEKNSFLEKNPTWRDGQLKRENFTTKNKVIAKDMRTDEKIIVSCEEYKNNKFLISMNTKKVKIKKNNRIIFKGYLDLFLLENTQYNKAIFYNALRSDSGDVIKLKGKNKWITDEKLNIRWL